VLQINDTSLFEHIEEAPVVSLFAHENIFCLRMTLTASNVLSVVYDNTTVTLGYISLIATFQLCH
jgi:hypothetical protein